MVQSHSFDFDAPFDRRGTGSLKWDSQSDPGVIPMWVADMDFPTAPAVAKAVSEWAKGGMFGYSINSPVINEVIVNWWESRYQVSVKPEWILPFPGVIPAVFALINSLTGPGEGVIIQPPVYDKFCGTIELTGRTVVPNKLIYKENKYRMDFADLELKAAQEGIRMMLLCSPHNPVGRVWNEGELEKVAVICAKHGVTVVSDEIHADLIVASNQHHSFAAVAAKAVVGFVICSSPSKSFGLAGLGTGYIICPNPQIKTLVNDMSKRQGIGGIRALASQALIAAYTSGAKWLDQLKTYIRSDYSIVSDFFGKYMPLLKISTMEGTFPVWIDCNELNERRDFFLID